MENTLENRDVLLVGLLCRDYGLLKINWCYEIGNFSQTFSKLFEIQPKQQKNPNQLELNQNSSSTSLKIFPSLPKFPKLFTFASSPV